MSIRVPMSRFAPRSWRPALALLPGALLLAACEDEPSGPGPQPASIQAAAIAEQSAAAGAAVAAAPKVIVRDAGGNALAGIPVTFSVTAGSGQLGQSIDTTDASGAASAGRWTLGTEAGLQSVRASVPGLDAAIVFRATATAGTPTFVLFESAASQTAATGALVAARPTVVVRDQFGNALAGVPVNFSVESGGGTVTGGSAMTDAYGMAAVGAWTLGVTPGEQRLRATASGVTASFSAVATLPAGCGIAPYEIGATIPATWTAADCRTGSTSFDEYELTLAQQGSFKVQLTGPSGRTIRIRRKSDNFYVGEVPMDMFAPATSNPYEIQYMLEAGTYILSVIAPSGTTTGSYTLATVPVTSIVCRPITFGTANIVVNGTIDAATDCPSPVGSGHEDWLVMLLKTGDKLRFTMTTTTMAPLMVWRDDRLGPASPTLKVVGSPTPGTIVLDWTATFDGFHEMVITHMTSVKGAYTLTVQRLP